jgi:hypothetical protein
VGRIELSGLDPPTTFFVIIKSIEKLLRSLI